MPANSRWDLIRDLKALHNEIHKPSSATSIGNLVVCGKKISSTLSRMGISSTLQEVVDS